MARPAGEDPRRGVFHTSWIGKLDLWSVQPLQFIKEAANVIAKDRLSRQRKQAAPTGPESREEREEGREDATDVSPRTAWRV